MSYLYRAAAALRGTYAIMCLCTQVGPLPTFPFTQCRESVLDLFSNWYLFKRTPYHLQWKKSQTPIDCHCKFFNSFIDYVIDLACLQTPYIVYLKT